MNRHRSPSEVGRRARRVGRLAAAVSTCGVLGVLAASCADMNGSAIVLGNEIDAGPPPPSFAPQVEDAEASAPEPPQPLELCIATECPWPLATCGADPYKCTTNLANDAYNCGACGSVCPTYSTRHVVSHCAAGKCELECAIGGDSIRYTDCNGIVDDGCEVDLGSDPENCGSCGHACAPGDRCHAGVCGCPAGQTDCDGACRDLMNDVASCGACGVRCSPLRGPCSPRPRNTFFGCVQGSCGHLVCSAGHQDCNGDLGLSCAGSDGCEVDLLSDPKNCGACGKQCSAGEICQEGECLVEPPPGCPKDTVLCQGTCVDYLNDVKNCGGCSAPCAPNGSDIVLCKKGMCTSECSPGRADCDGIAGCETNVMTDTNNCGACGNRCDTDAGQPCIAGKCLMTACDAGGVK